jgi:hypothetical protein
VKNFLSYQNLGKENSGVDQKYEKQHKEAKKINFFW